MMRAGTLSAKETDRGENASARKKDLAREIEKKIAKNVKKGPHELGTASTNEIERDLVLENMKSSKKTTRSEDLAVARLEMLEMYVTKVPIEVQA